MKKFLLSDVFWGLLLTMVVAGGYLLENSFLESVELKFYDFRARFLQEAKAPEEVAIVAIDDSSLAQLGRWPWPRSLVGRMVEKLDSYDPKVIGLNILFSEPSQNPGVDALAKLETRYRELIDSKALVETPGEGASVLLTEIQAAKTNLDEDAKLATALQGKKVVLPMFFTMPPCPSGGLGGQPKPLPPEITKSQMGILPTAAPEDCLKAEEASYPLALFSGAAAGLGHINVLPDRDGTVRSAPLAVTYDNAMYPAYALELIRVSLGLKSEDMKVARDEHVILGRIEAPLDAGGRMNITYRGPRKTFSYYSFFDVLNDKVAADQFKGRIVLLGPTAVGLDIPQVTPSDASMPSVELVGNTIENLLHKKFLTRPSWGRSAEMLLTLLVGVFVSFLLPRLKAGMGAIVSTALLAVLLIAGMYFFVSQYQWLQVTYPALLLAAGYTVIVSKRFLTTEKRKELVEASQIETSKMLGLSFQGQGMLDLAFEKFRACPLDENIADLLYNLGLDFERKRQYNKSVAVYEYIGTKFKGFKDTTAKLETLRKASEGAVFGGSVGRAKDATIMAEGAGMKPTLGRYEVEKELGRGAMGIVYLGKDPKINRMVAIKTMMLELEGTPEQVKELKMRFFREAESAGNLNHPGIVRIFDAGEENEIAYIAMELLEGHDLKRYCDRDNLLPLVTVLDYCAKTADGLDYAHAAGVFHRDIKPANIMLLKDGTLRITDFGIARIAASSKTATGTVMGTPSYMSPEQVAGKRVDGRADLWSLGVMLYEMATGEKPFKGEAIGTLLYQIASEKPPAATAYRPDLPSDVLAIIDKCLQKNPDDRYQRGGEIAADLRRVIDRIRSGAIAPPASLAPPPVPIVEPVRAASAFSGGSADKTMVETSEKTLVERPSEKTLVDKPSEKTLVDKPSEKTLIDRPADKTVTKSFEDTLRMDPPPGGHS